LEFELLLLFFNWFIDFSNLNLKSFCSSKFLNKLGLLDILLLLLSQLISEKAFIFLMFDI